MASYLVARTPTTSAGLSMVGSKLYTCVVTSLLLLLSPFLSNVRPLRCFVVSSSFTRWLGNDGRGGTNKDGFTWGLENPEAGKDR